MLYAITLETLIAVHLQTDRVTVKTSRCGTRCREDLGYQPGEAWAEGTVYVGSGPSIEVMPL